MEKENIKGGKVIGSGGFGCVFKPELKCKNKPTRETNKDGRVTKLMKKKYAKTEFKGIEQYEKMLNSIPNYQDYFLVKGFSICEPDELTQEDLEKFDKKCGALKKIKINSSNVNENLDKLLSLNMPYGGIDVGDYIEYHKMDYKKIINLNKSLIELLKNGILKMNNKNIYHCDIKDSNVLVYDDENFKTRLIDWGLSTAFKEDGTTIPKQLTNRPFQFNVPFSVVLFNDKFTKMYSEFLKKNPNPTFFSIREFVIHYVIKWIDARGPGHLRSLNSIFRVFFERGLVNVEEQFKKDIIEFDYTFYFIFEYISQVLFKFTKSGKFEKMEYFSQVFLKNLDVWGFTMIYLPILEYINNYYDELCDCEIEIVYKIKNIILYIIECSYSPIDSEKLTNKLEELNELFEKAEKKSTTKFEEKRPTSSTTKQSSTKTSSKKKSSTRSSTKKSKSKTTASSTKTGTRRKRTSS
jgi:hypothetical protein